jgi:hypothetical protein
MSAEPRKLQLLITISIGDVSHDVTVDNVSIPSEPNPVPAIPAFAKAVAEDKHIAAQTSYDEFRARKRLAQCLLMDQFGVENGDKSIAIALHRHWTSDLRIIFGPPDSPSTIKRLRSQRGTFDCRRLDDMRDRPSTRRRRSSGAWR